MSLRTTLGLSRESSLMAGTPAEQRQAWREWRRENNVQQIKDRWPEIPSGQLVASRYWIEHTETGLFYREFGGDPAYAETVCAYYLRDGWPVMLERWDKNQIRFLDQEARLNPEIKFKNEFERREYIFARLHEWSPGDWPLGDGRTPDYDRLRPFLAELDRERQRPS